MNAGFIRTRLIRYLDWYGTILIPEFSVDGGGDRADLVQITRTGLAVEYEIKTSYEDWRDDRKKPKWTVRPTTGNQYISRFYYVTPGRRTVDGIAVRWQSTLRLPERIAPGAGLIVVTDDGYVKEVTAARRHKVPPMPEAIIRRAKDAFYYRYWRLTYEHETLLEELADLRERHQRLHGYAAVLGAP